ncbi:hypothetical protein [Amycolatopsis silviterrae]|uniref:Uncharacterized protein n=1 Tax=Amycolatopsis silviterrae TaxID=1656914 RepID=A0ABW5H1D7_9PSEU
MTALPDRPTAPGRIGSWSRRRAAPAAPGPITGVLRRFSLTAPSESLRQPKLA